jgi:hypothetical protein
MADIEMNLEVESEDFADELSDEALDRARSGLKICGAGCAGCAS